VGCHGCRESDIGTHSPEHEVGEVRGDGLRLDRAAVPDEGVGPHPEDPLREGGFPLGEKPGGNEYSLTPERYAHFLKTVFDLWHKDLTENNYISVRNFDNYVQMAAGYPPESCGMSGVCTCYFVIESNGGVYPCDFYVLDEWLLGNIKEKGFDELIKTEAAGRFVESSKHINDNCKLCRWYSLCRGGCRRTREPFEGGKPALNYYCPSYKEFFDYAGERINNIAKRIKRYN